MRRVLVTAAFAALLSASCGGDGNQGSGGSGGSGHGSTGSSSGATGVGSPTGPGDGTWKKAFAKDGVGVSCEATFAEMTASGAPSLTVEKTTLFVGFEQLGNNQDPVFFRFDDQQKVYCEHHEHESPDGRALGVTWAARSSRRRATEERAIDESDPDESSTEEHGDSGQ